MISQSTGTLTCSTIRIMEFPEKDINPSPLSHGILTDSGALSECSYVEEEYLSPQRLHDLTGIEDLSQLVYLEMKVDATENSLGNFGIYLPNLLQLKLNDSVIKSVRDVGSSLKNLTVLWMSHCGLEDLDGISSLSRLQELYLSHNELTDVSPLSILEELEILDLAENRLCESEQLGYLGLCPKLVALLIYGNPFCSLLSTSVENYQQAMLKVIPHLQFLDQRPLTAKAAKQGCLVSQSSLLSMSLANVDATSTKKSNQLSVESLHVNAMIDASTDRMQHMERPATVAGFRSSITSQVEVSKSFDDCSDLTHGLNQVICGNPARALRARRKKKGLMQQSELFPGELDRPSTSPAYYVSPNRGGSPVIKEEIMEDLRTWRNQYEKLSLTLRQTGFNEPNIESPPSPMMQQIDGSDGLTVTATKSVILMDVEQDDDTNSKHHGNTKKRHLPATPHPPSSRKPQPPGKHTKRPNTAGDFRTRRYRQRSVEESVQFVDTLHHEIDSEGGRVESHLDSKQPNHLIDINGQYQDTYSHEASLNDPEHIEKKPPKKLPNPPIDTDNPIVKASTRPKIRRKLPTPKDSEVLP